MGDVFEDFRVSEELILRCLNDDREADPFYPLYPEASKSMELTFGKPYVPKAHQRLVHENNNKWMFELLSGGVGSGKTACGAVEFVRIASINARESGIVVAPTFAVLDKVTLPELLSRLKNPTTGQSLIKAWHKKQRCIILWNGFQIYYGSADRPDTLEGVNVSTIWLDEGRYCKREAHDILQARLRSRSATIIKYLITTTPAIGWLSEEFTQGKTNRRMVRARTLDNAENLRDGFVDDLKKSYSARLVRQMLDGEFVLLQGACYGEELDITTHFIDFKIPEAYYKSWPIYVGLDFGYRRPAVLFIMETRQVLPVMTKGGKQIILPIKSYVVIDQMMPEQTVIGTVARDIKDRIVKHGWNIKYIYCDPDGLKQDEQTGIPAIRILENESGVVCKWTRAKHLATIGQGMALVRGLLRPADGSMARLYIDVKLERIEEEQRMIRGICKDIQRLSYPDIGDKMMAVHDKPHDDGLSTHSTDALRYFVVNHEGMIASDTHQLRL